jgi:hypothetical protein
MRDEVKMISRCSSKVGSERTRVSSKSSMKKVKFQLEPRKIAFIPYVEGEGVWHSQKSLLHIRDVALDTALQSRYDPRYPLWNTLFKIQRLRISCVCGRPIPTL